MSFIEVKSFAKINLALNVTGKLKLLHKIESIVSFISLSDLIFIKKVKGWTHLSCRNHHFGSDNWLLLYSCGKKGINKCNIC